MGAARPAHYEESNVSCPGTFYYVLARRFAFVCANSLKRHSSPAISLSGVVVMNSSPPRQPRISLRASLCGRVRPIRVVGIIRIFQSPLKMHSAVMVSSPFRQVAIHIFFGVHLKKTSCSSTPRMLLQASAREK